MGHIDYITTQWLAYALGENEPLSALFDYYKKPLLLIAYRYVRCKKVSEDIVADTFEKLISLNQTERKNLVDTLQENPMAFLHIVVKNKCLDYLKKTKNRYRLIENAKRIIPIESWNDAYIKFTQDGLKVMLDYLEPREKEVIELHLNGFTNDEIAAKLNLKYNTVKNNIYEAKLKLKRIWKSMM